MDGVRVCAKRGVLFEKFSRKAGNAMIGSHVLRLAAALLLFLGGMRLLCSGLQRCAHGRLQRLLAQTAGSLPRAVLFSGVITAVVQSSSAVTVMLVGLSSGGALTAVQTAGFVAGANIGTCSTAFLVALGLRGAGRTLSVLWRIVPLCALLTARRHRAVCRIGIGLFCVLTGLQHMQLALEPLSSLPAVHALLMASGTPCIGFLAGILLAVLLQSSSAGIALLQTLSASAMLPLGTAVPVILGQNIGTCSTALLSAVGAGEQARHTALLHLWYNVGGAAVLLPLWLLLPQAVRDMPADALSIAMVHLCSNLLSAAVFLGVCGAHGVKACERA